MFRTYMLPCAGGALYVAHTDDVERRIAEHETGSFGVSTGDRLPVRPVWSQAFASRIEAGSKAETMALIRGDWVRIVSLAESKKAFDKLRPNGLKGSRTGL